MSNPFRVSLSYVSLSGELGSSKYELQHNTSAGASTGANARSTTQLLVSKAKFFCLESFDMINQFACPPLSLVREVKTWPLGIDNHNKLS